MATTMEEVLKFEPDNVLVFDKRGNETPTHTTLKLTNSSSSSDVLFRVQTTSPAYYRVRPSHGRIPVGSHAEVQVVMIGESQKADKFLIKYVSIESNIPEGGDFLKHFQEASSTEKERRLRVSITGSNHHSGVIGENPSPLPSGNSADNLSAISATHSLERRELHDSARSLAEAQSSSTTSINNMSHDAIAAELKDARIKLQSLTLRNQELTKSLDETKGMKQRGAVSQKDQNEHPSTRLPKGITEAELDTLIRAQAGFPPVLVILIAVFSFLVGLLF